MARKVFSAIYWTLVFVICVGIVWLVWHLF